MKLGDTFSFLLLPSKIDIHTIPLKSLDYLIECLNPIHIDIGDMRERDDEFLSFVEVSYLCHIMLDIEIIEPG